MAKKYMNNDITLIVSGEKFMANKAIISEKSDYFKAMFSSEMLESKSNQVEINGISSKGFGDILGYMQTLKLEICMENILDILDIVNYIQISDAIKQCEEFLMSKVDTENYSTVVNIAECYSLVDLKEHVLNFIDENFWDLSQTESFCKLGPEQIHHAVAADKVVNFSELDLLEAVLQWGLKPSNLTIEEKLKHVEDILDHVRFYEISKKELNERLKIIFSENCAIHLIHEKITQLSVLPCNSFRAKFSTRGLKKAILRVGACDRERIVFNFINDTKWIELTKIPNPDADIYRGYNSVVLNNELYTIVTCRHYNEYLYVTKFSHKTNNWETIEPINDTRWEFSICEVDDKIYAIGGFINTGKSSSGSCEFKLTNTVERYDPMMKTWEYIASLPQARCQHASVNFANILYISGGSMNGAQNPSTSVMKYNPLTNTWLSCAPLLSPRSRHTMITYGDKIYVCGGFRERGVVTRDIEEYDVANDSWRFLTTVPDGQPIKTAIFMESNKFYILRDVYDNDAFYEIDCYDVETNEWSKKLKENKYFEYDCIYEYHTMYLSKSLADE